MSVEGENHLDLKIKATKVARVGWPILIGGAGVVRFLSGDILLASIAAGGAYFIFKQHTRILRELEKELADRK